MLAAEGKNPLELLAQLEKEMTSAAQALEFEKAAKLRDRIRELRQKMKTKNGKRRGAKG